MRVFDNTESLFDNYSLIFGIMFAVFVAVFVAAVIAIIVNIVKRNKNKNRYVDKSAPHRPARQKKVRTDVDPFGLTDTPSPFAELEHSEVPADNVYAAVAAAQDEAAPPDAKVNTVSVCPFCGAPREPGKFCPFCGNKYE